MRFYNFKKEEIDTIPYEQFENDYNSKHPGSSYIHENIKMVTYWKLAWLAGWHKKSIEEAELLRRGAELFDERQVICAKTNETLRQPFDSQAKHRQKSPELYSEIPAFIDSLSGNQFDLG